MAEDNASIVRIAYEAFNDRALQRGAAVIADDCELVDVPSGSTFHGPEGYKQSMEGWLRAFPDGRIEITNLITADEWVIVEFTGRGTNTGPLQTPAGEVPPTGRTAEMALCDVVQVRDGRITRSRSYYDAATLLGQLGLMAEVPVGATA